MAKSLFSIDNKYLVLQLSYSNIKPRFWFYTDKSGNRSYVLFGLKILLDRKYEGNWGIGVTFFALNLTLGFPILLNYN